MKDIRSADFVIGVDRGAYWLIINGIHPQVAIGDFDSTSRHERALIKRKVKTVKEFPSEKDKTDLELAIDHAISLKPKGVVIYGVIGSRFDHTLVAVNLLEKLLKKHIDAKIRDRNNEVFLLQERRTIFKTHKYLSLLPYTQKAVVTIRGVLYPTTKRSFYRNSSLGISNEIVGKRAEIIVHSGIIRIVQSSD
ncbi:thiamine diphosphokinase [Candidatus Gottesmanbacteria bacterium]|nr:thiamine diphosphokinase [Candidatus Gottesmanbacteria bacterium]